MDPVSALGLAASAIQFVSFAGRLLQSTVKIHKTFKEQGPGDERLLDLVVADLQELNSRMISWLPPRSSHAEDNMLAELCQKCNDICAELLQELQKLRKQAGKSVLGSFRIVLRNTWGEDKLLRLQGQIRSLQNEIIVHCSVYSRQVQEEVLTKLNGVDNSTQDTKAQIQKLINVVQTFICEHQGRWSANIAIVGCKQRTHEYQIAFCAYVQRLLRYQSMNDRLESISDAATETFKWIFEATLQRNGFHGTPFLKWLETEEPIYYIAGKVGSGKSTLVKYMVSHGKLKKHLQKQTADRTPVVLSFYFWNSGSILQRVKEGLLRTLLYQALKECPDLAALAFPYRFEVAFHDGKESEEPFSIPELSYAVRNVMKELGRRQVTLIMVDGLDEFEGKPQEIIDIIRKLAVNNVKVCTSSRPLNAFNDEFNKEPHLRLEELNRPDIQTFVSQKFRESAAYKDQLCINARQAEAILDDIVSRASGVFLWVSLVVSSVLEGLADGYSIEDVRDQLDTLPEDLEALFWKILKSTGSTLLSRASQIFQLIEAARTRYTKYRKEYQNVSRSYVERDLDITWLAFAAEEDPSYAFKLPIDPLSDQALDARKREFQRKLIASTKGLVETTKLSPGYRGGRAYEGEMHFSGIRYIHRSVRDFVCSAEVWQEIVASGPKSYDAIRHLTSAYIAMYKTRALTVRSDSVFMSDIDDAIIMATICDARAEEYQLRFLDELDRVLSSPEIPRGTPNWTERLDVIIGKAPHFLHYAVVRDLIPYLKAKIAKDHVDRDIVPSLVDTAFFNEGRDLGNRRPWATAVFLLDRFGAQIDVAQLWEKFSHHKYISSESGHGRYVLGGGTYVQGSLPNSSVFQAFIRNGVSKESVAEFMGSQGGHTACIKIVKFSEELNGRRRLVSSSDICRNSSWVT